MFVYWMPYLNLAYPHKGAKEYRIGRSVFIEDTPQNWLSATGRERPKHLEIHRDFTPSSDDRESNPLYGTIITSEDDKWLTNNIDVAVAVLYFLGDTFQVGRPAECFAYHRIAFSKPSSTGDSDLVGYWTKHGYLMESSASLALYPPLAVRGNQAAYRVNTTSPEFQELLHRISTDPNDRIVVAVRQYLRTQFTDTFTSPLAEDYALHCGALEAALGIDALQGGVGERFVAALAAIYGTEDSFEDFFLGLFIARSLFVHGVSSSP